MATLNYSHTEQFVPGMAFDYYYCSTCGALHGVQHGTAPQFAQCEECDEVFSEVDFNDQIG